MSMREVNVWGEKIPPMSRMHFQYLATMAGELGVEAQAIADYMSPCNGNFDEDRFIEAVEAAKQRHRNNESAKRGYWL